MWSALGNVSTVRSGSAAAGSGGAAFVQTANVNGADFAPEALARARHPARSGADARLRPGDVLISTKGRENRAAVFPEGLGEDAFATLDVAVIRCDHTRILPAYLATILNMPGSQATLKRERAGSGVPRIALGSLQALEIPIPSLSRQKLIVALAEASEAEQALSQKLTELRGKLRTELLRRAVEEKPAPGGNPARVQERSGGRGSTDRAYSNRRKVGGI